MDSRAEVRIVGDASSGIEATERFADAASKAAAQVKTKLAEIQSSSKQAFAGFGREANDAARDVNSAAARVSSAADKMKSAGSGISSIWKGVAAIWAGSELVEWGKQLFGVAQRGLEFASSLGETAQQLGVSSAAMQEYRYVASQVGISNDEMDAGLQRLTRAIGLTDQGNKKTTAAFRELHVAIRDTNGQIRPTEDVLHDLIKAFSAIKDPAQRAALEITLFGKAGQKFDTMLSGGISQIDNLRNAAYKLGLVLSKDQIDNADDTADKLASVKRVLEANIAGVVANNSAAIFQLANSLAAVAQSAIQAAGAYATWLSVSSVRSGGEQGDATARGLLGSKPGRVAAYAEAQRVIATGGSSPFGSKNDVLPRITTSAERQANVAEAQRILGAVTRAEVAARRTDARRPNPNAVRPETEGGALPSAGGGKPSKPKGGGGGGGGGAKVDVVAEWRKQLEDQLLLEENWGKDSNQLEIQFWSAKLKSVRAGSKQEAEVLHQLHQSQRDSYRDTVRETIAALNARFEVANEELQAETELTRIGLEEKLDALDAEQAAGELSSQEAKRRRRDLLTELARLDQEAETKSYQLKLASLKDQQKLYAVGTVQYREYLRSIELLETQHRLRLRLMDRKAQADLAASQRSEVNGARLAHQQIARSWGEAIGRMATLQQGFGTTFRSLWGSLRDLFAQAVARMVELWLISLVTKEAASKSFHLKQILMDAKAAAAGAWKAVVGIPVVGPILAPIAAAAAFAGVMAFSAEGGYDVPGSLGAGIDGRGGQLGIVHPREMVLPAEIAERFRNGGASGGGDTFQITALDARSFARFLKDHHAAVGDAVRHHARQGGATSI